MKLNISLHKLFEVRTFYFVFQLCQFLWCLWASWTHWCHHQCTMWVLHFPIQKEWKLLLCFFFFYFNLNSLMQFSEGFNHHVILEMERWLTATSKPRLPCCPEMMMDSVRDKIQPLRPKTTKTCFLRSRNPPFKHRAHVSPLSCVISPTPPNQANVTK